MSHVYRTKTDIKPKTDFIFCPSTGIVHPVTFEVTFKEKRDLNNAMIEILSGRSVSICLVKSISHKGIRIYETDLGEKIKDAMNGKHSIVSWINSHEFNEAVLKGIDKNVAKLGNEGFYRRTRLEWIKSILARANNG